MILCGHITQFQELRFRLRAEDGRAYLFTLGRQANVEPRELEGLFKTRARITCQITGEPNLSSGVVESIRIDRPRET